MVVTELRGFAAGFCFIEWSRPHLIPVHTGRMSKLRRVLGGAGYLGVLGGIFCLVGLLMLVTIIMTPDGWAWWMDVHSVQGRQIDGLVYYSVDGVNYTVNDPQVPPGGRPQQTTVYYVSSQPSDGSLNNTGTQLVDWGSTAGPGAAGLILLATGLVRSWRGRRPAGSHGAQESFGHGIPSETIKAIMDRNKGGRGQPSMPGSGPAGGGEEARPHGM